jgi:hypothetical protein
MSTKKEKSDKIMLSLCYGLNMKYPPLTQALNAWSPAGCTIWEVLETLGEST